jgi:hypothetical protein
MFNVSMTVFDGVAEKTALKSVVSQSWLSIFQSGFGESTTAPGLLTDYDGTTSAIGRAGLDKYDPELASNGDSTNTIYAGVDGNGVGFLEFGTYIDVPEGAGFADYSFALSVTYDWSP